MCVSMDLAAFTGTALYAGRLRHPDHGLIHVLGYQNTAVNLATGPNAMLLHLPTRHMKRDNFLPTERGSDVLDSMVDAVRPPPAGGVFRGMGWMGGDAGSVVEVFEHDIYTVLLATDPAALPDALAQVPERKRPQLKPDLFQFYADVYPGHAVALCCFDNAEAAKAEPLFLWYPPTTPEILAVPALDCHTGEPPEFNADVQVDHWVIFGTDEAPADWGRPVDYGMGVHPELSPFLPRTVMGTYFWGGRRNGDFAIHHDDLLTGDLRGIQRHIPR